MATILIRGGTTAEWAASTRPLALREPGFDTQTFEMKLGDGVSLWADLVAVNGQEGPPGEPGPQGAGIPPISGSVAGQVIRSTGPNGAPIWANDDSVAPSWDAIADKPTSFIPSAHNTEVATLRKGGAALLAQVVNLLNAGDVVAARAAIGAGTGNGTSNLQLGTSGATAMPGNKSFPASEITSTPTGSITATTVQAALEQIATALSVGGGGGGGGSIIVWRKTAGGYPTLPTTKPIGVNLVMSLGDTAPTLAQIPSWLGLGASQIPLQVNKVATQ